MARSRTTAGRLLPDGLPEELTVATLCHLTTRDLAALATASRALHGAIEAALRFRLASAQLFLAPPLPPGEPSWLGLLLRTERRHSCDRVSVATGAWHSLFVDSDDRLLSCGVEEVPGLDPRPGLLGHGAIERPGRGVVVPTPVAALHSIRVRSVAASTHLSLALSWSGAVFSWGRFAPRQGGTTSEPQGGTTSEPAAPRLTPKLVTGALQGVRVRGVAAGHAHALAWSEDGGLYSWGHGSNEHAAGGTTGGMLGHGDLRDAPEPRQVEALDPARSGTRVIHAAAGELHSLAVTARGDLFSFGDHVFGQCGQGAGVSGPTLGQRFLLPTRVQALERERVLTASAGDRHSLCVTEGGAVHCWGTAWSGAPLGLVANASVVVPAPRRLEALEGVNVASVSAGAWAQSFAISTDGQVYSWGLNSYAALGHGDDEQRCLPTRVEALRGARVRHLAASLSHAIAVGSDGAWCWGRGAHGMVGVEGSPGDACVGLQREALGNGMEQAKPRKYPQQLRLY
jgi:alpha-tubulin suppressor-like RCC1 family protein